MHTLTQLQMQNELETRGINAIFAQKQEKEEEIQRLEQEIDHEKRATETMVRGMEPAMAERYQEVKTENERIQKVRSSETAVKF